MDLLSALMALNTFLSPGMLQHDGQRQVFALVKAFEPFSERQAMSLFPYRHLPLLLQTSKHNKHTTASTTLSHPHHQPQRALNRPLQSKQAHTPPSRPHKQANTTMPNAAMAMLAASRALEIKRAAASAQAKGAHAFRGDMGKKGMGEGYMLLPSMLPPVWRPSPMAKVQIMYWDWSIPGMVSDWGDLRRMR